ncbi:MAG: phospho-sugar mutase [Myxococcaceae bacterium]
MTLDDDELRRRAETWLADDPDPETVSELQGLLARDAKGELRERFGASLTFGTAGLRGVLGAGPNRMNRAVVRRVTAGLARYLLAHVPDAARRGVVVGRDARRWSDVFAQDAAGVLAAHGILAHVFDGVVPTPVCAFAVTQLDAAAGVMVTASHNPPEYNGYKVYWGNGAQIVPPHELGISGEIERVGPARDVPLLARAEAEAKGRYRAIRSNLGQQYLDAIDGLRLVPQGDATLSLVYTALHGVGGHWAETALRRAGYSRLACVADQHQPDGAFPTVRFPNPEEPGALDLARGLAESLKADVVLANDPDADRLAVMARDGAGALRMLSGNELGVLLGHYLLTARRVSAKKPLVITTVVSSTQLRSIAHALNAEYEETLTGFKWIANQAIARERDAGAHFLFGYEEALGYCVGSVVRDKDGLSAALLAAELAAVCRATGETLLGRLERLQREFGLSVGRQHNVTHAGVSGAQHIAAWMNALRGSPPEAVGTRRVTEFIDYQTGERLPPTNMLVFALGEGTRVIVRPSGTEPKVKFYFELREGVAASETVSEARRRAESGLDELVQDFLDIASEREKHVRQTQ